MTQIELEQLVYEKAKWNDGSMNLALLEGQVTSIFDGGFNLLLGKETIAIYNKSDSIVPIDSVMVLAEIQQSNHQITIHASSVKSVAYANQTARFFCAGFVDTLSTDKKRLNISLRQYEDKNLAIDFTHKTNKPQLIVANCKYMYPIYLEGSILFTDCSIELRASKPIIPNEKMRVFKAIPEWASAAMLIEAKKYSANKNL